MSFAIPFAHEGTFRQAYSRADLISHLFENETDIFTFCFVISRFRRDFRFDTSKSTLKRRLWFKTGRRNARCGNFYTLTI